MDVMNEANYLRGSQVKRFEERWAEYTGAKECVTLTSGTDALHTAGMIANIKLGDEVIVPAHTFISTAEAFANLGATLKYVDSKVSDYGINEDSIEEQITNKTKAIVYPHLFGSMSDTKEILDFCKEKNIAFIEDACQALGSSLNEIKAGTIGDVSTLSFNANKVVAGIAGGGAVLTNDIYKAELFTKLRKHGEKEILGYNSKMLIFNAEFINFRLKKMEEWITKRQEIAKRYDSVFKDLPIHIQDTSNGLNHNYHKYVIRFKNKTIRDVVKGRLNATIHYDKPLSENFMYENIEHRKDDCINCKRISETILSLPIHPYLTDEEVNKITNMVMITV